MKPRVCLVGATHGNEWTGAYLIQHGQQRIIKECPHADWHFLLANEEAYKQNKRFIEEDLNRSFTDEAMTHHTHEGQLAKKLRNTIQGLNADWLIDLHSTTSNMGVTLIITELETVVLQLCHFLVHKIADCRVLYAPDPTHKYLGSQGRRSVMIEVGPIAQGTLKHSLLEKVIQVLKIMDIWWASPRLPQSGEQLEYYEEKLDIRHHTNQQGQRLTYISPQLESKDFQYFPAGVPALINLDQVVQQTLPLAGYPVFIEEAAYAPTKLAFTLTEKKYFTF